MEPTKNIDSLFSIKLPQCTHIYNLYHNQNPQKSKITQQKGNLFLGGVGSYKAPIIEGFKITAVLSILGQKRYHQCQIPQKLQHFCIKKHKWIPLQDKPTEDVSVHFAQTHQFIKQSLREHNVLVHCQFGRSRSASVVIAFLMRELKIGFDEAYKMVYAKRDQLQVNEGFVGQLRRFQKEILSQGE